MNIVIFGTGLYYEKNKNNFRDDVKIVAFLDNNKNKQGQYLDNILIFSPEKIKELEYDYVFPLSVYTKEMKLQLLDLGVHEKRIITEDTKYKIYKGDGADPEIINLDHSCKGKNILMLSHAFTFSGAQNVLLIAVELLKNNGYNVVVLSNRKGVLQNLLNEKGILAVYNYDLSVESPVIKDLLNWSDAVIINTLLLHFLVEDYAKSGKPVLWWLHESGKMEKTYPWGMECVKDNPNITVYSVSNVINDYLLNDCNFDIDIKNLCFGIRSYKLDKNKKNSRIIFLNIGGISKIKGQDILFRAIDSLPDYCKKSSEFIFIGGGIPESELKEILDRNNNIQFRTYIDNKDIPKQYENADVVICSSREESMSIAVMEGFMNGLPAIISNVTGIKQFMMDGREGFIVPTEDSSAMAEKIKQFIDEPELIQNMGENAKKTFYNNFTLEIFEKKLLAATNELFTMRYKND